MFDISLVTEELQRILDRDNTNFIDELKGRRHAFCQKLNRLWRFYVCCHYCSPPHVLLQRGYEMRTRLWCTSSRKQKTPGPVPIVGPSNCLLAVGDVAITTFPKDKLTESAVYLTAYYYTLHLTYPKCVANMPLSCEATRCDVILYYMGCVHNSVKMLSC